MDHTYVDRPRDGMELDVSPPSEGASASWLRLPATRYQWAAAPAGVALAYFLAAKAGAWLAFPSAPVSALWAPNAILLAAMLLARRERWWLFLLAVLPLHLLAQLPDITLVRSAIQYFANCAEAVIGALALLSLCPQPRRFDRLRTVVVLVLFAGVIAPFLTSLFMVWSFALAGIPADFWLTVTVRTITNTFAIVALVPLIVHGVTGLRSAPRHVPHARVFEGAVLAILLAAVCIYVFALPAGEVPRTAALLIAPLPLLVWATIRFGVAGSCSAALLVGAISAWGVLKGHGPFDIENPLENALSIVSFHVVICVTFVFCAALIEEWRAMESGRARAEGLHSAVLGSLHDQIAVLDSTGTIVEVNESWRRAVELAHPARFDRILAGGSYFDACVRAAELGCPAAADHLAALRHVLEGRETRSQFEYQEPSGQEKAWIEVSIEKLKRPEGGAVVTRTDVTARRRAEREARNQQQQLAHLGRVAVLGQLSGAFAHELNQPLTSILGNAEAALRMLESGSSNLPEIAGILRDIVQDDERAARVIDRLRALLEKGDIARSPVDLNAASREVLELARGELVTRHVDVNTALDGDLPVVNADRVQMQQIVLNLLMNACEAVVGLPVADRRVSLTTRYLPGESCVQITVSDNGAGIPAADLERIFQPFVTTKPHGMGLGLAICRSVAESHRGRLWAENGPQGGAAFHLRIPVGGELA